MAITKILARSGGLKDAIRYVLNGDKTEGKILTASQRCSVEHAASRMEKTKARYSQTDGVQYYHLVQSFKKGEVTPELALEIAKEFVEECLPEYEAVIGTHIDKGHIHSHIILNSVNAVTGKKYHSDARNYYKQIRAVSDRLCRKHGLSVIITGEDSQSQSVSYIEWLRQSRGQPTFRSMLEEDLRRAIEDAGSLGEFFMIMENLGYEIKHGNRLSFRLRGQERFMCPGRRNPLFTEDGILAAIRGNLADIEAGRRPATVYRPPWQPYQRRPKYKGFMALYVHYLYILGKIEKRQYPPRMTPKLRRDVMKFEELKAQFAFLRKNNLSTTADMDAFIKKSEDTLADLTKQRTILNVRKKKRRRLYEALRDAAAFAEAKRLYSEGVTGVESECARYEKAVAVLEKSGVSKERLAAEKADIYEQLAQLNREIRAERKKMEMCREIREKIPDMKREIQKTGGKDRQQTRKER